MSVIRNDYVPCPHSTEGIYMVGELIADLGLIRRRMLGERLLDQVGADVDDLRMPEDWFLPNALLPFLDGLCRELAGHDEVRERVCELTLGLHHRWPDDATRTIGQALAWHLLFKAYRRHEVELMAVPANVFDRYPTVIELASVLPPIF
jgi:hypothetical protein